MINWVICEEHYQLHIYKKISQTPLSYIFHCSDKKYERLQEQEKNYSNFKVSKAKVLCKPHFEFPSPVLKTPVSKWGVAKWGSRIVLELAPIPNFKSISMMGQLPDTTHHRYVFEILNRGQF